MHAVVMHGVRFERTLATTVVSKMDGFVYYECGNFVGSNREMIFPFFSPELKVNSNSHTRRVQKYRVDNSQAVINH